jgi:hypothetical protein
MNPIEAFRYGWCSAWRARAAAILFWLLYSLAAALVAAPATFLLYRPLAHSRLAQALVERFDFAWLMELTPVGGAAGAMLTAGALLAALVTWLLGVLLAGGALAQLCEYWPRFSLEQFLGAAGRNFGRLLRLSLFGLPCYALAALVAHLPLIVVRQIYGDGMEYAPIGIAKIVSTALTVLALGLVATCLDYAKVRLAADDVRGAGKALLHGFAFVFRHFARTLGVWLLNALLFLAVGVVYLLITNELSSALLVTISLVILLQQLFIVFRAFQRIAAWGAAAALYAALRPVLLPPEEPAGVPASAGGTPPTLAASAKAALDAPPESD